MPRLSLDRLGQASLLSALPVRIPGCVLWLDAGSLRLTSGDAVGTWTDLSGSGNHATQATAGNKPKYLETADFLTSTEYGTLEFTAPDLITRTVGSWVTDGYNSAGRILTVSGAATAANNGKFTIESATATVLTIAELTLADEVASTTETVKTNILNGRPAVRFDGTSDYLVAPLAVIQPEAFFIVGQWRSVYDAATMFDGNGVNSRRLFANGGTPVYRMLATDNDFVTATTVTTGTFQIIYALFNGASSELRINGGPADAGNPGSGSGGGSLVLGALGDPGSLPAAIDFATIIVYNRVLPDAERQRLERYLGRKYAITVTV